MSCCFNGIEKNGIYIILATRHATVFSCILAICFVTFWLRRRGLCLDRLLQASGLLTPASVGVVLQSLRWMGAGDAIGTLDTRSFFNFQPTLQDTLESGDITVLIRHLGARVLFVRLVSVHSRQ